MMVKIVTIWFILTTVPGNGLCCCSFMPCTLATLHAGRPVYVPSSGECCSCCSPETFPASSDCAPDVRPQHAPCPCKDKKPRIEPAMPDKAAGNDLLRAGSSWSGWCHGFYLKGGTMLTVTLNGCDRLPIVLFPANAHLHLYQILRC